MLAISKIFTAARLDNAKVVKKRKLSTKEGTSVDAKREKLGSKEYGTIARITRNGVKDLDEYYRNYLTASKERKHELIVQRLQERLQNDIKFRVLYLIVSRIFAIKLQDDRVLIDQLLHAPKDQKYSISARLSLAGKWAPSPGKAHDKQLHITTAVASILFPEIQDTVASRVTLQKKVLAPLRSALDIPEVKMSSGAWTDISYAKIPSKSMA